MSDQKNKYVKDSYGFLSKFNDRIHPEIGGTHPLAKLSLDNIDAILHSEEFKDMGGSEVAKRFGVSRKSIYKLRSGESYKYEQGFLAARKGFVPASEVEKAHAKGIEDANPPKGFVSPERIAEAREAARKEERERCIDALTNTPWHHIEHDEWRDILSAPRARCSCGMSGGNSIVQCPHGNLVVGLPPAPSETEGG